MSVSAWNGAWPRGDARVPFLSLVSVVTVTMTASGRVNLASALVCLTEMMPNLHVFALEKELKKFPPADAVILLTMPPRGQEA